ncbi:flagellar biosynthesis protein FliP, partial [bacterium]
VLPVFAQAQPGDLGSTNFLDSIDLRKSAQLKELGTPLQLILFMSFLTLLPFFFIMTTSFVRTIIVLGFLRQAIGTQQVPPNQVIMGISIFLTIYIMSPVWQEVNEKALSPYLDNKISQSVAMQRGLPPIRNFMLKYTKKEELSFFMRMVKLPQPKNADDVPLHVVIPAFMVSELSTSFKIGFFLFLPFLVVDLVVANTLLALGMMMLSPVTISMPFKLLIFTLANGWYLILQALVTSFRM